jgi:hypothetical protein
VGSNPTSSALSTSAFAEHHDGWSALGPRPVRERGGPGPLQAVGQRLHLGVDVWTTNERLQHYYLRQGFTYVRTVVLPHNPSGALFQRPAQRVPTPRLEEVESLTG